MEEITFSQTESDFGLIIRDKKNPDRYVVLDFEDIEILIERWNIFKKDYLK